MAAANTTPAMPAITQKRSMSSSEFSGPITPCVTRVEKQKEEPVAQKPVCIERSRCNKDEGHIEGDDPFSNELEGGVKYKTLEWWHAGLLLVAETISLGILSLPKAMATVGFLPGIVLIIAFGIITTYTGYVIGQLKSKHLGLHSFAHAGELLFGRVGREIFETAQSLILIFIMAAHVLTFTVMMNVLTGHATCTIVWGLVGMVISLLLTLPRTLKSMSILSIFSCASITIAILITMIAIGMSPTGDAITHLVTPKELTSVHLGAQAVSNIVVAYSGHVAFFGFISELQRPQDFPKALILLQTIAISFYITVAVVVYAFAGDAVKSPALSSASPLIRKIAFGISAPTIIIAGVINAHIAVKNMYVRIWRDWQKQKNVMAEHSVRAYGSWCALCVVVWGLAWVIASAIPVFGDLLGLIGALFCSWFSLGLPAVFWLWMFKGSYFRDWKKMTLFGINIGIFLICVGVCVTGIYGSAISISAHSGNGGSFSCADNSL